MNHLDKPQFSNINLNDFETQFDKLLAQARAQVDKSEKSDVASWQEVMVPLEEDGDAISKLFSPISHLNSVKNADDLREVYERSIQKLSLFHTEVGQNKALFEMTQKVADSDKSLNPPQIEALKQSLIGFKLSGVDLPDDKKARLTAIEQSLSKIETDFSNHILDCTDSFEYHIEDVAELEGVPEPILQGAKAKAEAKSQSGYLLGLDFPTYLSVLMYATSRKLREIFYIAFSTRASDQGPHDAKFDNQKLMDEILKLRHEKAILLGFANFAEYSIEPKMASSTKEVIQFLEELADKSMSYAKAEIESLRAYAKSKGFEGELQAWDMTFYSEKYKQENFNIDQEALRKYFPTTQNLSGLFKLAHTLFEVELKEAEADVWHEDVQFYELYRAGKLIGGIYIDLYARAKKRGGAWMDSCRDRRIKADGELQLPVAYLTCNFQAPVKGTPATLTHDDVITLFHEFGHCLQHLLTQIDCGDVSGINGVAWDAVELPSQFMENYVWEWDVIQMISKHIETGESLPKDTFEQLRTLRQFQSGMQMLRQIEFSLFDFKMHMNYNAENPVAIQDVLNDIRAKVAVVTPPAFNRFQHSFAHIFAGGYAAGYYSYKWAEVLSSDAYSKFEEDGILNPETGKLFRDTVLGLGGSQEAMDVFVAFRGREPKIDALLAHSGLK